MTWKVLNQDPDLSNIRQFKLFDDFVDFEETHPWTTIQTDTNASVAIDADGVGGIMTFLAGTDDNVEGTIYSTNEIFKFVDNQHNISIARINLTEATTGASSFMFGQSNAIAANMIQDSEAGPAIGKQGAVFFKPGLDQTLFVASAGSAAGFHATSTTRNYDATDIEIGTAPNTGNQTFLIYEEPHSSTEKRITYFHDPDGGQNWRQVKDSNGNLIKHIQTIADASQTELALFVALKNSSASETQQLDLDYLGGWQIRPLTLES